MTEPTLTCELIRGREKGRSIQPCNGKHVTGYGRFCATFICAHMGEGEVYASIGAFFLSSSAHLNPSYLPFGGDYNCYLTEMIEILTL